MGSISGRHMSGVYCKIRVSHWWPGAEFPVLLIYLLDTWGNDWQGALWAVYRQGPTYGWKGYIRPQAPTWRVHNNQLLVHVCTDSDTDTYPQIPKHTHVHAYRHRNVHICTGTHTDTYVDTQRHTPIYILLLKQMHTTKPCLNLCQGRAPHIAKDGDEQIAWEVKEGRVPGHSGLQWETIFQK